MYVLVTRGTLRSREFIDVVRVALVARHSDMFSVQTEPRASVVIELNVVIGRWSMATRALLSQLSIVEVVVAALACVIDSFIAAFLMAGLAADVLVLSNEREGSVLIVIENEIPESFLRMAGGAGALELAPMHVEMTGVAVRGLL